MAELPRLEEYIDYEAYYLPYIKNASKSGDQLIGLCPFHDDQQPSFSVNLKTGQWNCKAGCCKPGNVISFEEKIGGGGAYKRLCERYNIPTEKKDRRGRPKTTPATPQPGPAPANVDELFIPEEVWEKTLKLPAADQAWYKSARGWTPEAIEKLDIRLQTFYRDKKTGEIKNAYKKERVAIPIRDSQGRLRNIRLYLPKNDNPKIPKIFSWGNAYGQARNFPAKPLNQDPEAPIYFCEGESDTICAVSMGLNAITHTGKPDHYTPDLVEPFVGRDVIICYDADEPGQTYAKKAAKELFGKARRVWILQWPDFMGRLPSGNWPKKGGEDLTDFFVRHKQTVSDFEALTKTEFTAVEKAQVEEAASFKPSGPEVYEKDGCYFIEEYSEKGVIPRQISDFTLEIKCIYDDPVEWVRMVVIKTRDGRTTKPLELYPDPLAKSVEFRKWVLQKSAGDWRGRPADLVALHDYLKNLNAPKVILRPDHVGWIPSEGLWLFRDHGIKDGRVYPADCNGAVWIGNQGIVPRSVNRLENDGAVESCSIPDVRYDISEEAAAEILSKLIDLWGKNTGSPNTVKMVMGYVAACAYMAEIFPEHKCPILFVYGQAGCGKNTFARILMSIFGMVDGHIESVTSITTAAMMRLCSHYSNIPVCLDDYRVSDKRATAHDTMLRSAYDRVGGSRGTLSHEVKSQLVRAPVILLGESFPADSALASRCIEIGLSEASRRPEYLKEIMAMAPRLSAIFHWILKRKTAEKSELLLKAISEARDFFIQKGMDARVASLYATVSESYFQIIAPDQDDRSFLDWVINRGNASADYKQESSEIGKFFEYLMSGDDRLLVMGTTSPISWDSTNKFIYLWMPHIYKKYQEHCSRIGVAVESKKTIVDYLEKQPYYVGKDRRYFGQYNQQRAIVLNSNILDEEVRDSLYSLYGPK